MKKKVLIWLAVVAVVVGITKFVQSKTFVEGVVIPTAQKHMADRFYKGESFTLFTSQLDSIWKEGISKIMLIPANPSDAYLAMIEKKLNSMPEKQNVFLIVEKAGDIAAYEEKFGLPVLQSWKCGADFLFLNDKCRNVCVIDIRKDNSDGKNRYIVSMEQ